MTYKRENFEGLTSFKGVNLFMGGVILDNFDLALLLFISMLCAGIAIPSTVVLIVNISLKIKHKGNYHLDLSKLVGLYISALTSTSALMFVLIILFGEVL